MAQSLSQLWTHIIFSTKKRYPFLKNKNTKNDLHNYIASICDQMKCKVLIIGGIEDHVHILLSLHKNISLAVLIEKIKSSSSRWIKQQNDCRILNKFYWQKGYGAFSVSESNVEKVKEYIENQDEHHKKVSFQDELRNFLNKYKICFDEKYIWE